MSALTPSRFAGLSAQRARAILAGLAIAIAWGLAASDAGEWVDVFDDSASGDAAFFERIAERVRGGEGYYAAASIEARRSGYPTHSVFNFRIPTYLWLLSAGETDRPARWLLASLAVASLLLWIGFWLEREKSVARAVLGGLLLVGAMVPAFTSRGVYFAEAWSGVLVGLSLVAYLFGRWRLAVVAGLAALLVRELALPYLIAMLALAYHENHRREAAAWCAALGTFAAGFALHASRVAEVVAAPEATGAGWLQWGGWSFVLDATRSHPLLLLGPEWVTAVVLPFALVGLTGWRSAVGARAALALAGYCVAFLAVGQSFNVYWGLIYAPLVSLGVAYAQPAVFDLTRAAAKRGPA